LTTLYNLMSISSAKAVSTSANDIVMVEVGSGVFLLRVLEKFGKLTTSSRYRQTCGGPSKPSLFCGHNRQHLLPSSLANRRTFSKCLCPQVFPARTLALSRICASSDLMVTSPCFPFRRNRACRPIGSRVPIYRLM